MKSPALLLLACLLSLSALAQRTFTNPLKPSGPDPWVLQQGGWYYYMNTTGRDLTLWRTHNLADLSTAEKKVIFTPTAGTGYAKEVWAPEIHFLDNKWYVYFAADSANNLSHRIWAIENPSADPLSGTWTVKGKVGDANDHWAIDLSVFDFRGKRYAVWSGWEGRRNGEQDIFISEMTNPWTLKKGRRTRISSPTHAWEQHGEMSAEGIRNGEPVRILVNEGPEPLQHDGRLFVVYSANACWLDYCLGLLTYRGKGSLLKARNWTKSPTPVFTQAPENGVYAPGHGGFFCGWQRPELDDLPRQPERHRRLRQQTRPAHTALHLERRRITQFRQTHRESADGCTSGVIYDNIFPLSCVFIT